ncbi:putative replication protein [uncultured virus]|uniref:ATP-dependent helicase Rep n=1 Tax=uncultured virus TaxID=340016 RepID=A0A1I9XGC9_9VIRU|nr:putative replication protein [uncultured virus]
MNKLPHKVRWFVFTNYDVNTDYKVGKDIRFIAYGNEVCPTTGRPHHQGFLYTHVNQCHGKRNLHKLAQILNKESNPHVEPMYGKITDNEYYCSKENELIKIGDEPKQGARGDIQESCNEILAGKRTADQVCVENPEFFHQYGRTLDRVQEIAFRKQFRKEMTKGIWYTGPSGAGKSHKAFTDFHPDTHYSKNLCDEWWDGYTGQETVILNEFRGQIKFAELLDLTDKWPKTVKVRNKAPVPFLAKTLIITSVKRPEDIYINQTGEPWEQFSRRFDVFELESAQKCS